MRLKFSFKKTKLFLVSTISTVFFFPAITNAGIVDDIKSKIGETSDKMKSIEAEISAYSTQLKKTQAEKNTLNSAIKTLDINKQIVTKDISLTQARIENTNDSLEKIDTGINELRGQISSNREYLRNSMRIMAVEDSVNKSDLLTNILASESISDAVDKAAQMQNFQRELLGKITKIKEDKQNLEEVQNIKIEQKNELYNLNQELVAKQKIIQEAAKQKAILLAQTKNKEANYQAELKKKQQMKKQLAAEMASYEEQLRVTIDPTTLPQTGAKLLSYPVSKPIITQYFGNTAFATKNAQVYSGQGHNGIDLGAPVGTRITAAANGVIAGTGNTDAACPGASYGKWVLIKHNNGLSTLYAHLSTISVSAGQAVGKGDMIGLSGNTGYSTGPHLHFTVYASKAVSIITRQSKACGTMMTLPVSPQNGYLNPLSYL